MRSWGGTVIAERFQGGERNVILVSATESDQAYLLASSGFLLDPWRLTGALIRAERKMILVAWRSIFQLFLTDEEQVAKLQLWKNLLLRTCQEKLWDGTMDGQRVQVWGCHPHIPLPNEPNTVVRNYSPPLS